jgi:hypothetical protein
MKRAKFTEEQIIGILRENEAGAKAGELARKHGVSEGTSVPHENSRFSLSNEDTLNHIERAFINHAICRGGLMPSVCFMVSV